MTLTELLFLFITHPDLLQEPEIREILDSQVPINQQIEALGRNQIVRLHGNGSWSAK